MNKDRGNAANGRKVPRPNRRRVLQGLVGTAIGGTLTGFSSAVQAAKPIKIGYVSPKSGPLAGFAEADEFVLTEFRKSLKDGIKVGSQTRQIEIVVKDSQSNPNRAAEMAKELITRDDVSLMVVGATPETVNPVATQCELEQIPCISSLAPWQTNFIGRQANPADPKSWKPFDYTYHYFWGLEDVIDVFTGMWSQVSTNKMVGALFPNDADGNAWGDPKIGFPPVLAKQGYKFTDSGRFQNLTDDFSSQIAAFRNADVEIVTGVIIPPDFTTFWNQARQKSFKPKVVSVAKALLFPTAVQALGKSGNNISTEVWWTPTHPYKSSLNGTSAAELARGYEQASGKQWTQFIGFVHSLFEVAVDAIKRSDDSGDGAAISKAIGATKLDTIVGRIEFGSDRVPSFAAKNIAKTPLVGGQWRLKGDKYDMVITENRHASQIPLGGEMQALS
ncbi:MULTISPECIES: ABC transporter substrate-binding protein [unclassified Bradyrhizobium]|uniref:ABC transporter substrate-binding protein n=1 Tax=unclassified Bradyrhizobium TaxID=2631580 RepID=UPI002478C7FC|nr:MULTISPECIES: ABC transporter substrate-binding protein [unclassified Bradyrhizobium]WGR73156.1 ABC transporter substrate-binding protein [Bradyrhizobium sp. ISRA426]WGR77996.1 ABC transporter substrate-binding protein [Bradyrhizobium sp. ISRA430]WGR88397.1 ABC transporter substrate-binding protein [Bradyrhizobium sp. ISRA432]